MLSLDGYTVWDRIHASDLSEVYSGVRRSDGLGVVIKLYLGSPDGASRRAQHELELLERIDDASVVRPVEVRACGDRLALVLERFSGQPLTRYVCGRTLDPTTFLGIALAVTRALAAVHDARVIHKDVKLGNLLIQPEPLAVCLIDFGISAGYGRAERVLHTRVPEGTWCYMAPEQTGRTGLGIDFRTDLYSLGATFYELLTGKPPFHGASPKEVVAAQIAQRPRPVIEVAPRVPLTLSRIVAKLLEKDPELRYQTARGLLADLELCQKQLATEGAIDDGLVPGSFDHSDRLRFPHRLYGRESEGAALTAALERVSRGRGSFGGVELVLISGPPGIGKSTLAGVLREPLARIGGFLAEAKFDSDRQDRPYAGFQAALERLIEQFLVDRAERSESWASLIRRELGAIGGALCEIAPLLSALVEDLAPVPPLSGKAARERLALAVARLVRAVARPAHPLVIFLDDLQWADAGSLFLLRSVLSSSEPEALLVVAGYRDAEVGTAHPFSKLLADLDADLPTLELELEPLGLPETTALLADALGRSPEDTDWLARRIGPKSQHNPLLLRRLLFHLWDRDLIRYQHGTGWTWDERGLLETDITDDAAAMVAARIDGLPASMRRLLRIASLVGRSFEYETVVELADAERGEVLRQLMDAVDQGLLAPCPDGFAFVHDRLREAAQHGLADDERAALHHRAAQLLLARTPVEQLGDVCFQLAEHLAAARALFSAIERSQALQVFRMAASRSLAKGSAEPADHYARLAAALLSEDDWRDRFDVAYDVCMLGAEAAIQVFDEDHACLILETLERRPMGRLQKAAVGEKQLQVSSLFRPREAAAMGLAALRRYGVRFPSDPSPLRVKLDILRTDWALRSRHGTRMFSGPRSSDLEWLAPLMILRGASPAFFHHSNRLSCLTMGYALRLYRKHGSESPSTALASYAATRPLVQRDLRGVARYARTARDFLARELDPRNAAMTEILLAFVESWTGSRRHAMERFDQVATRARDLGQVELHGYAILQQASFSALSGDTIESVLRRAERLRTPRDRSELRELRELYLLVYGHLGQPDGACFDLERGRALVASLAGRRGADIHTGVHLAACLCLLGDFADAAAEIERLWPQVVSCSQNGSARADYVLYRGICQAALAEREPGAASRRPRLRKLARCLRQLRAWARDGGDFVHMARLLEAEALRVGERPTAALLQYEDAARLAERCGHVHHAAFAHERRAQLLRHTGRIVEARSTVDAALRLYRAWGSAAKVRQLERWAAADPTSEPCLRRADRKQARKQLRSV